MLFCAELGTVFKLFCKYLENKECGNIGEYKKVILEHYPNIVDAEVNVARYKSELIPFENWRNEGEALFWWKTYGDLKHNMYEYMANASFKNAAYALSALYIVIHYFSYHIKQSIDDYKCECISSRYNKQIFICAAPCKLPGTV